MFWLFSSSPSLEDILIEALLMGIHDLRTLVMFLFLFSDFNLLTRLTGIIRCCCEVSNPSPWVCILICERQHEEEEKEKEKEKESAIASAIQLRHSQQRKMDA